jgi:hypothetical protein
VFLILHAAIFSQLSSERRPPRVGDANTLWLGIGFLLWGAASLVAARFEDRSILFQILNTTRGRIIGWIFTALAALLLATYVGLL